MAVQRYADMKVNFIREGVERRLGYTQNLMMTIFDFNGWYPLPGP
jgi:hypothetical protein